MKMTELYYKVKCFTEERGHKKVAMRLCKGEK